MPDGTEPHRVERVERRVVVPAPAYAVWQALTEAEHLSAWFGGAVELDAFPGGQIAVTQGGRRRRGIIVDLEPGRRLAVRWLPAHHPVGFVWEPDPTPPGVSGEVTFTLEPAGGGTALTVVETAPDAVGARPLSRARR